jgi:hypothetical protein
LRKREALSRLLDEGKIQRILLTEEEKKGRIDHYLEVVTTN